MVLDINMDPTYTRIEPYKRYNFALFKSHGIAKIFDTLRYDRAFLVRPSDVATLMQLTPINAMTENIELLVCKYDWRDKMHPTWTYSRLLSDQKLSAILEFETLRTRNSPLQNFQTHKPLKVRSDLQVTGTVPQIMATMYNNMAMPCEETDATALEAAFFEPERDKQELTIRLTTFMAAELPWKP